MAAERTVHVVDDDAPVRRSLERLLRAARYEPFCYESAEAFLAQAPAFRGGCVLLDFYMPGMDGLEVQARLRDLGVHLPVILITGHGDVSTAVRAMKAGAVDFIEKPYDDAALIAAIEAALARGSHPRRGADVADAQRRIAALTPRERQVLDALVDGRANKSIAFDLGISVRTVELHRARMMERLGVHQFAEAIRLAVTARLGPGSASD